MKSVILFLLAFVFWALLHSLSASNTFKHFVRTHIGKRPYDGLYRLVYNVFAVATFLPVLLLANSIIPNTVLWRVPEPFSFVFVTARIVGLIGSGDQLATDRSASIRRFRPGSSLICVVMRMSTQRRSWLPVALTPWFGTHSTSLAWSFSGSCLL